MARIPLKSKKRVRLSEFDVEAVSVKKRRLSPSVRWGIVAWSLTLFVGLLIYTRGKLLDWPGALVNGSAIDQASAVERPVSRHETKVESPRLAPAPPLPPREKPRPEQIIKGEDEGRVHPW